MPWLPSYGLYAILLWPTALAQTSTVVVIPTPLIWQDAQAYCGQIGHTIYPVPATPTDAVYDVLEAQSSERFWIRRRTGGSCTCLNRDGSGDKLEEAPCGDALPFFCKDCSHGGDGGAVVSDSMSLDDREEKLETRQLHTQHQMLR
ncbi:hypothetical protein Purlil1_3320 [Purpureocillium lilacinum]|uniref:C-type lectin domain-containing protein n=1 Tax=Purpureocillium lilacinum TaxID=33203 RepID=A0ABR0C773_PURLI|nr:hypothetical protein Purlil1_3320 [Purpureocillium lilacinum]